MVAFIEGSREKYVEGARLSHDDNWAKRYASCFQTSNQSPSGINTSPGKLGIAGRVRGVFLAASLLLAASSPPSRARENDTCRHFPILVLQPQAPVNGLRSAGSMIELQQSGVPWKQQLCPFGALPSHHPTIHLPRHRPAFTNAPRLPGVQPFPTLRVNKKNSFYHKHKVGEHSLSKGNCTRCSSSNCHSLAPPVPRPLTLAGGSTPAAHHDCISRPCILLCRQKCSRGRLSGGVHPSQIHFHSLIIDAEKSRGYGPRCRSFSFASGPPQLLLSNPLWRRPDLEKSRS